MHCRSGFVASLSVQGVSEAGHFGSDVSCGYHGSMCCQLEANATVNKISSSWFR